MDLEEWIELQKDKNHRFKKRDLAKMLHIHPTTLSRTLSGATQPNYYLALEIEKITNGDVRACDIVEDQSKFRFCECGRRYKLNR